MSAAISSNEDEDYEPTWYAYEGGATINEVGPERGLIVRDEEFGDPEDDEEADARVTLEQGRCAALSACRRPTDKPAAQTS